ncbi:MAG: aminomethyltransferase beta-barrel domain-containing protein, partial [Cyanobium sp.]
RPTTVPSSRAISPSLGGRWACTVGAVNWIAMAPPGDPLELQVQVRYRSGPVTARLTPLSPTEADHRAGRPHRCRLDFADEQFSITPGQAAVFYAGEVLLGGGLIQPET